ncbi:MAG: hypothetical protein ACKPJD_39160, partial [Planctomycetaceae bacterium]
QDTLGSRGIAPIVFSAKAVFQKPDPQLVHTTDLPVLFRGPVAAAEHFNKQRQLDTDHFATRIRQVPDRLFKELLLIVRLSVRVFRQLFLSHAEQREHFAGMPLVKQVQPKAIVIFIQPNTQLTEQLFRLRPE